MRANELPETSRILVAAASVLVVTALAFPLWGIYLTAPQYPEGIGMYIRANTIVGLTEFDLTKINNLNHYIGMRAIEPESIPELRFMPWLIAAIAAVGGAVAAFGRRRALHAWLSGFAALAALGLADFYRWAYDYGHNLDAETAIITVPGMSYQPPLIGTKQLLNFTATSWPALGGWLLAAAIGLGIAAAVLAARSSRRAGRTGAVAALAAVAAACGSGPSVRMEDHHAHHGDAEPAPAAVASVDGEVARDATGAAVVVVSPDGATRSIAAAIASTRPGGRVIIRKGTYREARLLIDKPLTLTGEPGAVIDGAQDGQIMTVAADNVTIRGLEFRNGGTSFTEDHAAIKVAKGNRCVIENNRIENAFFGIYLAGVADCRIANNVIRGTRRTEATSGNGIHLWNASDIMIEGNTVSGHRDGIYFEFVRNTMVHRNVSQENLRYGLHFMYSDDCRYEENVFRHNAGGVAVMYTKRVEMIANRFEDNWGSASYGLLLKEIYDATVERNAFHRNTVGILADGAVRLAASNNEFMRNGWAVRLLGSTYDGRLDRNDFIGNTFDVTTNGPGNNRLSGNYFDSYRGYDLDRDGTGDVPHHPVRLFSVIVEQNDPAIILLRSTFVDLLDLAERVLPTLTPASVVDPRPAMRRARPEHS